MASFRLILQSGSGAGTEYPLEKAELFLGRDLSNDIVINDPEVSRRHARILMSGMTYTIEDLGSTNGTFIRGQRLGAPVVLKPGEIITIGEKVLLKFDVIDPNATVAAFRTPVQPQAATVVPPAPVYTPPQPVVPSYPPVQPAPPVYQPVQPAVAPVYAPVAPVVTGMQPQSPVKKKKGWLVALLVVIGILLVFCIIPWVIIDATNSYCALFPGILNALQPGVCP